MQLPLQVEACPSCMLTASYKGVLSRLPGCDAATCRGTLQMARYGIKQINSGVLAGMTNVVEM
jgi:hypothetical protein